ncbi:transglutaminaseTgpA domain-containing protein [Thiomonas delicata]|nr:DUF3488 and transglutaminase-like domain-containing protein [Thiomonas delicata]
MQAARGSKLPRRWLAQLRGLPRDARDTLFLLAVAGITLVPLTPHLPPWAGLGAAALLAWRAVLAWRSRPLPARWMLAALLIAGAGLTLWQFRTIFGRDPGIALVSLLLGLKALETRNRRDTYVLFYVGFFGVSANFLYSQSAFTAGWMLLATAGWITALINANLPAGEPPLRQRFGLTLKLLAFGTPAMVVLFLLFPRFAGPLWALPSSAGSATGLTDRMDAGSIASLARDDSVAFRVKFHGPRPPERELYWRGPVLTLFNGQQWSPLPVTPLELRPGYDPPRKLRTQGPGVRYTITMQPSQQPFVFALDAAEGAPTLRGQPQTEVYQLSDLQLRANHPITQLTRYDLTSYPQFSYGPRTLSRHFEADLELPPGDDPRTVALGERLARKAQAEGGGPLQVAQAALQMFRREPFRYTLDPGPYPGRNQVDDFLFDRRVGFCEHYAQAFVVLMRAAGIPARVVTGYQGGRENPIDHTWVVRQSDAHAWAEYWVAGRGWLRADPTAMVDPARVDRSGQTLAAREPLLGVAAFGPRDTALLLRLRNLGDALNNSWNQWILDYGQARQYALLRKLGMNQPDWRQLSALTLAALSLAVSVMGLLLVWERRRTDPWSDAYARLRKRLGEYGIAGTPADAPLTLAARVRRSALPPGAVASACALLQDLERWRYAAPSQARTQRQRLAQLRRAVRRWRPIP